MLSQSVFCILFLFRLNKNFRFGRIGMKVVVFLRHEKTKTQNKP